MPGDIERLEALDAELEQLLGHLPTLARFASERLHAQLPRLPAGLTLQQIGIAERSLQRWLESYWQTRQLPPADAVGYYLQDGQRHGLPASFTPLLVRWTTLLGSETWRLYTDSLKRFWRPRRHLLKACRERQLRAELSLRRQDGTLPPQAGQLLDTVLAHPDARSRERLAARHRPGVYGLSLRAGTIHGVLTGSFILTQRDARGRYDPSGAFQVLPAGQPQPVPPDSDAGLALLYSLAFGLECFDSLGALHQELAERLDDHRQGSLLLDCLTASERRALDNPDELLITEVHADWLDEGVTQLLQRQRRAVEQAWATAMTTPADCTFERLDAGLMQAAALMPLIDRQASLRTRYGALLEHYMPTWMKQAPPDAKVLIVQSMQALALATVKAAAPGLPSARTFAARSSLLAYAKAQLQAGLQQSTGQALDPDGIFISTTTAQQTGPLFVPTNPGHSIPGRLRPQAGDTLALQTRKRSLTELALENVGLLDFDYWLTARAFDRQGQPVAGLPPALIKRLVREVNVANGYANHIRHHLLDSAQAAWCREAHYRLSLARMRAESLKAYYAGHLGNDREARAYAWITTLLGHPQRAGRPQVHGHEIEIQSLSLAGAPLLGILVLSPAAAASIPHVVVYTPDAPDRRPWRVYRDRAALLTDFVCMPALRDYAVSRAALAEQQAVRRLLDTGQAATAVQLEVIGGDFLEQGYLAQVGRALVDSDARSTSTAEADLNTFWDLSLSVLDLIMLVLPGRALVPLALGRAMISCWDAKERLQAGDRSEGLHHLMLALTYLSDAGSGYANSAFFGRTWRHLPLKQPLPLNPNLASSTPPRNLRYRVDSIYREGIYEYVNDGGLAQYFIEDKDGRRYEVDFDGESWLVVDERNPGAYFKAKVRKNATGEWVLPQDVRWDGLLPDLAELIRLTRLDPADVPRAEPDRQGIVHHAGQSFLHLGHHTFQIRQSLRDGRYRLLPAARGDTLRDATLLLRRTLGDDGWEIRVKQAGLISHWLAFPAAAAERS
jgi:hypothetical protein